MILKRIKLTDFRQFLGSVELKFATQPDKNVTIIHGENGVGKTAILNSIKWAFFAKLTSNFRNPKDLVNHSARSNGKGSCSVEIEFEEDDRSFLLIRRYEQKNNSNQLKIFEKNESVWGAALPEPELVINSMLPKEMAEYFFFQGEGSNAVVAGNNQTNLAKSIRDILGFKVAETLQNTLKKISNTTRKEIAAQDKTGESSKIERLIEKNESQFSRHLTARSNAEEQIPSLERRLEEVEEQFALINNQDLNRLKQDEKIAKNELAKFESKKNSLQKSKYSSIAKYGWAVFGSKFADSSLDFIDESQLKGRIPEPYNKTFIEDILSEAKCICGNNLEVGSDGYKRILSMLEKAANPQLLQRLSGIRAQIQSIKDLDDFSKTEIPRIISDYDDCDEQIQKLNLKLTNLSEQISSIPEEKIRDLQFKKSKLSKELNDQRELLGGSKVRITQIEEHLKSDKRKLKSLTSNNDLIQALELKQDFVDELNKFLFNYLSKMEKNIRLHVLKEVNDTLNKFSRHDFHINVSEQDFTIFLKDKHDNKVGQGDGLNLLLNLTITAALINFAAGRKNVKDPILNSSTVAPLVIDAPFGVLDKKYRNVVIKQLPQHVKQVVFLVSSSQWTEDMDEEVRDLIGSEYCLIMEESSPQNEKELDKVFIAGKEVITSRYNCDVDRTVLEEIN